MANYLLQHTGAELERAVHNGLIIGYGTCSTDGATVAKVVNDVDSGFLLETGATVRIKFTYKNTATNPTLNINGTGAKALKKNNNIAITSDNSWEANSIIILVYDGTNWVVLDDLVKDVKINGTSIVSGEVANIVTNSVYNASTNKIATMSDVGGSAISMIVEEETLKFTVGS